MLTEVIYEFTTDTDANRFLNELKPWSEAPVRARLFSGDKVRVSYQFDGQGFDTTLSKLDDLASRYNGQEVK